MNRYEDGYRMSFQVTMTEARFLRTAIAVMVLGISWISPSTCTAQSADDEALAERKADAEKFFRKRITPFIKTYCLECHQNRRPTEAGLSFTPALDTPGHAAFSEKWKKAAARVKAHDMPPDGLEQPTDEERQMFMKWLDKVKYLSPKDPGPFVIRRLTKTEYSNTLHDLFGVDPKIADGLPDEVSGEGYLNSLSPLQLEQYLAIADEVLDEILPYDGLPVRRLQDATEKDATNKGVRTKNTRTSDFQSDETADGQDVHRTAERDGQDVHRTAERDGQDVHRTAERDGQDVHRTAERDGQDVHRTAEDLHPPAIHQDPLQQRLIDRCLAKLPHQRMALGQQHKRLPSRWRRELIVDRHPMPSSRYSWMCSIWDDKTNFHIRRPCV